MNTRTFEVKTPDVIVKVKPDRTDLVETKIINGRRCLVIPLEGDVEVNGVTIRHSLADEAADDYTAVPADTF